MLLSQHRKRKRPGDPWDSLACQATLGGKLQPNQRTGLTEQGRARDRVWSMKLCKPEDLNLTPEPKTRHGGTCL